MPCPHHLLCQRNMDFSDPHLSSSEGPSFSPIPLCMVSQSSPRHDQGLSETIEVDFVVCMCVSEGKEAINYWYHDYVPVVCVC